MEKSRIVKPLPLGHNVDYIIHADGAYSIQHGEGAFSYVMCDGNDVEIRRRCWKITSETNNRAELKSIIAALYHLPDGAKYVRVESDSMYALNTLSGIWGRNANTDLFGIADRIICGRGLEIEWKWVKGHSGDVFNDICDQMCVEILGYDPADDYNNFKSKKNETNGRRKVKAS